MKYKKYDLITRKTNKYDSSDICLYLYTSSSNIKYVIIIGKILFNINGDEYFSFNHEHMIVGIINDRELATTHQRNILFEWFTTKSGISFIEKLKNIINFDLLQLDEYISYLKTLKINKFNL